MSCDYTLTVSGRPSYSITVSSQPDFIVEVASNIDVTVVQERRFINAVAKEIIRKDDPVVVFGDDGYRAFSNNKDHDYAIAGIATNDCVIGDTIYIAFDDLLHTSSDFEPQKEIYVGNGRLVQMPEADAVFLQQIAMCVKINLLVIGLQEVVNYE